MSSSSAFSSILRVASSSRPDVGENRLKERPALWPGDEHRAGTESEDGFERLRVARNRDGVLRRERGDEDRQREARLALAVGEGFPRAVERGPHGSLSRGDVRMPAGEHGQRLIEAAKQLGQGERTGTGSGELDGEGQPIETRDDLLNKGQTLFDERCPRVGCPFDEEGSRVLLCQGFQVDHALSAQSNRFAAGGQYPRRPIIGKVTTERLAHPIEDVLAVVEHDRRIVARQQATELGWLDRRPERLAEGGRDRALIRAEGQERQIDEDRPPLVARHGGCEARLPHSTDPDQRHQTAAVELLP